MVKVVGIDAGYVNFAMCFLDEKSMSKPVYWDNSPLFTGEFSQERLVQAIYAWINTPDIKAMLQTADWIVLEKQLVQKYQAVNYCIRFLYFAKTIEVAPATMSAYFKMAKTRKEKKKDAVALTASNSPFWIKKGKKDDLADAYLLACYGIFQTNPKLFEGWKDERGSSVAPRAKKSKNNVVVRSGKDTANQSESSGIEQFARLSTPFDGNGFFF